METNVARLARERDEALEQFAATSEVLKAISSSPGELEPVFNTILENAARICEAKFANLFLYADGGFRLAANKNAPPDFLKGWRQKPVLRGDENLANPLCRLAASKRVVDIPDLMAEPGYLEADPRLVNLVKAAGARTFVLVPMFKEGAVVGAIAIYRREVRPFTDKQIELVQNFAAQAVIGIENARLLNELRESLQQQTATSEVLSVISSSPGDLAPVFEAMLANATRICEAKFGTLYQYDGNEFHIGAWLGAPPALIEFYRQRGAHKPLSGTPLDRLLRTKEVIRTADDSAEETPSPSARLAGAKSHIAVPMFKDKELAGAIVIYRQEVRPFTDKQIAVVKNFAAQAVIAIENTRLLSELRMRTDDLSEALEQQTATSEVLRVISSSPGELEPVFQAILENATRICEARFGTLFRFDGEAFQFAAEVGTPLQFADFQRKRGSFQPPLDSPLGRVWQTKQVNHIADVAGEVPSSPPARLGGARSTLGVPMLKDNVLIGGIIIYRQEVRPFSDKQIELVQSFAAQAVIALENARLLSELRKRTTDLTQSLEDLRTAQDRLVQTEKLASLGQLTAGIAHEIKNPLNFVNNFSSVSAEMIDELQDVLSGLSIDKKARDEINELTDTLRGNLDKVVQHGKRADSIVKNMLLHSRQGSGEHRPVDINTIVEESLNLAYHGARAEKQGFNITLEKSFDPAAGEVDLFPQEITRVLLNLISNGFYATAKRKAEGNGADYEPMLVATTKSLDDRVEIRIRDNGTGIPPGVKEKMFNPFFTTKPAGEGTGLGLSLSHDIIVKQHGGSIDVDTQPGEFTEFKIILPRMAASLAKSGERA